MQDNWFTFDGVESVDFGAYIGGKGTFNAPSRSVNMLDIPGRDGALVGTGSYLQNMQVTYQTLIWQDFDENYANLREFLLSKEGYKRLEDTFHPDEYRMAMFTGPIEPELTRQYDMGKFDIVFSVKPQRWLLSGEKVKTFTASGTIKNPTLFRARPLIRIYGAGDVGIGAETITVTAADGYTDIDCDAMESYKDSVSRNGYVRFSGNDYPTIGPGKVDITLGTGITKVEITSRWWTV